MNVAIVAAVAENDVIGAGGEMPWHYPADLARFKELTVGHPVILGRRTFEAIRERLGGPLPDRTNIVLSRGNPDLPTGAVLAGSVEEALEEAAQTGTDVAYVAGGATIYEQFLPRADRLHMTEIPETPEGDTQFPDWDPSEWRLTKRETEGPLTFLTYERRS
jgi:dihydrofolate reductase